MTITKEEIITVIDADIASYDTKLSSLMSTGSISNSTDQLQIDNYTRQLCLLNSTKTWVESNL
jgi:hypothetical protein